MTRWNDSGAWITGLVLLGLGVLFLLDSTGVSENVVETWWPLLLIAWGGVAIWRERGRSIAGTLVLLLGAGFLLENLEVLGAGWLGRYWPVALIVVGGALLLGAFGYRRPPRAAIGSREGSGEWLDAVAVMSGRKEKVHSAAWRGGRATAVMGGVEIDLTDATPAPEGAVLHTTALMGGVEIRVPEEWEVVIHGTPLLGGFENKTHGHRVAPEGGPRLEVTGTAVMGGVEIKN